MWILHLIPTDWLNIVINVLIGIGIIGSIISWMIGIIPFFVQYKTPTSIVSTIFLVIGVFFKGSYTIEADYRSRLEEMEKKLAETEERAGHINTEIQIQTVEKIKKIKEIVYVNKQIIQEKRAAIDSMCVLSDDARLLYNNAIENKIPGSSTESDGTGADAPTIDGRF